MPTTRLPGKTDRTQIALTAQGIISENMPRQTVTGTTILVDGTAYFMALGLRAGDVCTGIACAISVAGAAMTLSKVGLYDKTGTRLAVSAELGTAWQSTGVKSNAFTATYTVPADDGYFACIVAKGGTLPTLFRLGANNLLNPAVGTGMLAHGVQVTQTDAPSPATITAGTNPLSCWVAVY